MILSMTTDPVENIRYNSAKTLGAMAKNLKDIEPIKKAIKALKDDKDPDVKAMAIRVEKELS